MTKQTESKAPGIVESLAAGFDAVTRAPQVLVAPVLLDTFLWLGPRLSAYPLIQSLVALLRSLPASPDETMRQQMTQALKMLDQVGQQFNMFAWLSPLLVGMPSLMANLLNDKPPWGSPAVWEVHSILIYLALFGLFGLVGSGLNAVYWSQIARAALPQAPAGRGWPAHAGRIWWGLIQLVLALLALGVIGGMPLMTTAVVASLFNPGLGQFIVSMGMVLAMWIVFYLAFVVHGLALRQASFVQALRWSILLMRSQFLPATALLILSALIYWGLGLVWAMPEGDSWLRAGAIVGNAFVASGVLCATAFFYLGRVPAQDQAPGPSAQPPPNAANS
ncbi:MAG: hypothetical protein JW850_06180 [Thermoflexales bacterium]|nr:hypothetical protein [Thermoflexales bacterium]